MKDRGGEADGEVETRSDVSKGGRAAKEGGLKLNRGRGASRFLNSAFHVTVAS